MKRNKPGMILLLQSTTEMMEMCEDMDECMVEVIACKVEEASKVFILTREEYKAMSVNINKRRVRGQEY